MDKQFLCKGYKKYFSAMIVFLISLCFLCQGLIFVRGAVYSTDAKDGTKNVLILNSYDESYRWTREQSNAISEQCRSAFDDIQIYVEYMDWKYHPQKRNLQLLYELYKYKYSNIKLDLIFATDNIALEFALQNRKEFFSDAPVIFSGITKGAADTLLKDKKNTVGVFEIHDPIGTMEAALGINPDIKNVYFIFDNTETGKDSLNVVLDSGIQKNCSLYFLNELSIDEIKDKVSKLGNDSMVLMGAYTVDARGLKKPADKFVEIISKASTVPIYDMWNFRMGNGVLGGSILRGETIGNSAAELGIRVLRGESPDSIDNIEGNVVEYVFDYEQMERFDIPIEALPKESILLNKPFSFFETYRKLVIGAILIFIALAGYNIILMNNIRIRKKAEEKLNEANIELTALYEEMATSDEQLKYQLEELVSAHEQLQEHQNKILEMAYHDILTKLPNRSYLKEYVEEQIAGAPDSLFAMLYIDIDNFKAINDSYGHSEGDKFLVEIGEKFSLMSKEGTLVFRLGGDEYVIVLKNIKDKDEISDYLKKIFKAFEMPIVLSNRSFHITLSAGAVIYPFDGANFDELLKNADIAMYEVKNKGKNNFVFYNGSMKEGIKEKVFLENSLREAVKSMDFTLNYQPILDIASGGICGLEALIRWNCPGLGPVSPVVFIKLAEENGLIMPIGNWVLKTGCSFAAKLAAEGYPGVSISINISPLQLMQADFVPNVKAIISSTGVEPHRIELEITESILIDSFDSSLKKLNELREFGIRLSLDDFGQGYSSLTYLRKLPISTLKIDKSFIDDIFNSEGDSQIVYSIIELAHRMELKVNAEGVENQEQLGYLRDIDCDSIQGYLISRPIPESEVLNVLQRIGSKN